MEFLKKLSIKEKRIGKWTIFFILIYIILVFKFIGLKNVAGNYIFGAYSLSITFLILSRFFIAYFYNPVKPKTEDYQPSVTAVVPAKNEGAHIAKTLMTLANSDYPKDKLEIITINDGSTDNTLNEMKNAKGEIEKSGVKLTIVDWKENKGKRHGMAEGVFRSKGEIIVFVDSDSFVEGDAVKELVKYFMDSSIGAVAGHTDVYNHGKNLLTKMQAVRYFVAFKAYKSTEAIFGCVTCCSGSLSAYRKDYLTGFIDEWLNEKFWGKPCTFGDDRSLTNFVLKDHKTIYAPEAKCSTVVPDTWSTFFRQQLRWKKSWTRESVKAFSYMWKKNPIMFIIFALGFILPLLAPLVVIHVLVWQPLINGVMPWFYISGLILISVVYGVYYSIFRSDNLWIYGVLFNWLYSLILVWQLPYAIANIGDTQWGTR